MNQAELFSRIAQETGLSKKDVEDVLKAQAETVHTALSDGHEVTLPGIGKLSTKETAARTGRNPKTGESLEIPAKTVPKFTAAKALKDAVA